MLALLKKKISTHTFWKLHKSDCERHPVKCGEGFSPQRPSPVLGVTLAEKSPITSSLHYLFLRKFTLEKTSQDETHSHFYATQNRCLQGYFKSVHVQRFCQSNTYMQ